MTSIQSPPDSGGLSTTIPAPWIGKKLEGSISYYRHQSDTPCQKERFEYTMTEGDKNMSDFLRHLRRKNGWDEAAKNINISVVNAKLFRVMCGNKEKKKFPMRTQEQYKVDFLEQLGSTVIEIAGKIPDSGY